MDEHVLLQRVKEFPLLYDQYRSDYRDIQKRVKTWEEVAKTLNVSSGECARLWLNISGRELKLMRIASPHRLGYKSTWDLFDDLAFVQSYIVPRKWKVEARANEIRLIVMVKKYPELYDENCDNFKNVAQRKSAWKAIADILSMPVKHCMRSWQKLRERYSIELQLINNKKCQTFSKTQIGICSKGCHFWNLILKPLIIYTK